MTEDEERDDITVQSRARFQQLLQENVEVPSRETKKKKKKMKPSMSTEESVMQQLKCLQKDEDPCISANTYHPQESTRSPKKKKLQLQETNLSSDEKTELESPKKTSNPKKKKSRPQPSIEENQFSNEDEHLLITSPKEKPQKSLGKKNKSKQLKGGEIKDEEVPAEAPPDSPKVETKKNFLKKRKTRKKEIEEKEEEVIEDPVPTVPAIPAIPDDGDILAVTIHRTDKLKNDFHISHPLVRVHIVNEDTGQYLSKQNSTRAVTSARDGKSSNVQHILPIMTQPFDFKQKKSTLPVWEDILLFNENYNYFVQTKPKVILFFEILDFVGMNTASLHYARQKQESGWYKIAWAFLKIVGANNKVNTGSKARLQLFEPMNTSIDMISNPLSPEVYNWWKNYPHVNYPSTLYVTVKSMIMPQELEAGTETNPQQENGMSNLTEIKNGANSGITQTEKPRTLSTWSRLPGQTCRVPNTPILTLKGGRGGCYTVKFSNDGRCLACGCNNFKEFPVFVYEIPSGQLLHQLLGHFGIIYDICWSPNDIRLCSASADGTVRVWNKQRPDQEIKLLPHPGYVYCCQFHVKSDSLVVTGGFDAIIRVWETHVQDKHGQLLQEIESHKANINTLCFDELGEKLYSGDSIGIILVWNCYINNQSSETAFKRDWTFYKDISVPEQKGIPINCLKMHCSGRRLLVHYRDSILRMVDLRINQVMQEYVGALNFRRHIRSTLSSCGTLIFAGSEDNRAYVWHTDTGDKLEIYARLGYQQPITGIDYHPKDHIIAFSSPDNNQPVYVYKYDPLLSLKPEAAPSEDDSLQASLMKTKSRSKSPTGEQNENYDILNKTRYEKAIKKLNSVSTLSPSMFSPHSYQTLDSTLQEQFFLQNRYSAQRSTPLRSDLNMYNPFGSKLIASPVTSKKKNSNSVGGSLQFSFETPKEASYEEVVALYDYEAQRSDELSFVEGDILKVLYKDTEHWWMGESPTGQHGFFPSNYVEKAGRALPSKQKTKAGESSC